MKVGNALVIRCVNKMGARLRTYYTWECGDGCCSERETAEDEVYKVDDRVTIDPEVHSWDGGDNLDGFKIDSEDWRIVEIPRGYAVVTDKGCYRLEYRPEDEDVGDEDLGDGLTISKTVGQGWWLWSDLVEMNIAIRAKTREEALIEGLKTLQECLTREQDLKDDYKTFYQKILAVVEPEIQD